LEKQQIRNIIFYETVWCSEEGIKPGFSWTADHRDRSMLAQASVRGGTKYFSSGYFFLYKMTAIKLD